MTLSVYDSSGSHVGIFGPDSLLSVHNTCKVISFPQAAVVALSQYDAEAISFMQRV